MNTPKRMVPNILVTGTPGVGKSTLRNRLSETTGLRWIEIAKVAKEYNCLEEFDEVYQCPVLDEDKLMDMLEEPMGKGGNIIDYHSCDFFFERWFDIVFVLRTDNTTLFDRLSNRGYSGKKLEDNVTCEIFETILEEAKNTYATQIVHELNSTTQEQMTDNLQRICAWLETYITQNSQ